MNVLHETNVFSDWLTNLKNNQMKARILARIQCARFGNFGDCEPVGEGISEMRLHFGPGYRVYFAQEGVQVYLLLCGGDKSTQKQDIRQARSIWREIKEGTP